MNAPGSKSWVYIEQGVTKKSTTFSPVDPGRYQFRARLRTGAFHSDWSPTASIKVQ
jgi:hypothetical protein